MLLSKEALQDRAAWEQAGFALPQYDRTALIETTRAKPTWIHLGAGNIFRAFLANAQQKLLNEGLTDTGILVAEGFDGEIIDRIYAPRANLTVLVTLKADGSIDKSVLGSMTESMVMDPTREVEWTRLKEIFSAPSLQMVSFTITEKGYNLNAHDGSFLAPVQADLNHGPAAPTSYMGKLVALLYERYLTCEAPLALVSMDNCSHNGSRLNAAVMTIARHWAEAGLVKPGFVAYLDDPTCGSFPWSMIDKITPRPDAKVKDMLLAVGFEDVETIITGKSTYVAPFVNAEGPEYLVIEDHFPNGRPPLDRAGVIFTDRETVDKVEKMKVCTCLNPLHTSLAVYGCLLGYDLIADEMKDPELRALVETIGYQEGLPVVVDPGILNPRSFIDEVLQQRIPNPFMPDTPQRIATDTSQKLGIRFGETIKAYLADPDRKVEDLHLIPLVLAGWCRYLLAVDDQGQPFELSPDPLLPGVRESVKDIALGQQGCFHDQLFPILSNSVIFGVNLYEAGLGERVEALFTELVQGVGAVRATLKKYTA